MDLDDNFSREMWHKMQSSNIRPDFTSQNVMPSSLSQPGARARKKRTVNYEVSPIIRFLIWYKITVFKCEG